MTPKRQLAIQIVDSIRTRILAIIQKCILAGNDKYDAWDELQNGVNWLDNEVGYFDDLYTIVNNNNIPLSVDNITTVSIAILHLSNMSLHKLNCLLNFMKKGGSDIPGVFEIRENQDVEAIIVKLGILPEA